MVIAYVCTTTGPGAIRWQREVIESYGKSRNMAIDKYVIESVARCSERKKHRLKLLLSRLRPGDIFLVENITVLSGYIMRIVDIIEQCLRQGITFICISDRYVFDASLNVQAVLRAFAIYRSLNKRILSHISKESHRKAYRRNRHLIGRPTGSYCKLTALHEHHEEIKQMMEQGYTFKSIYAYFNISQKTFYNYRRVYGLL